ncbi:MAG: hypothetical protein KGJ93_01910 [Patescibacteria group bacterium]|nr:hypothetical protein [Patescibacteria group bacterium]
MHQLTPPPQLLPNTLSEIRRQQRLAQVKRALRLRLMALVGSWLCFLVFWQNFFRQANDSGFSDLSRLMLSDFGAIKNHFYDYALSLAESLPAVSAALLALAGLVIIISAITLLSSTVELRRLKT